MSGFIKFIPEDDITRILGDLDNDYVVGKYINDAIRDKAQKDQKFAEYEAKKKTLNWLYPAVLERLSPEGRELEDRAREAHLDYRLAKAWSKRHLTGSSIDNFPQWLRSYDPSLYQQYIQRNNHLEQGEIQ